MKTLCVYYSRTGLSEQVAKEIAAGVDAELLRITDGKNYKGFFGYIKAAFLGLSNYAPELLPYETKLRISEYDKIIIVSPIWCEDVCPIIKSFLFKHKNDFVADLYYVATHMSKLDYKGSIKDLRSYSGKSYKESLSVSTHKHDWTEEVREFTEKIK